MRAMSARMSTIPGKDALGIEIPNKNRKLFLKILDDISCKSTNYKLPLALGKDIFGACHCDLARIPHLLVAERLVRENQLGRAMLLSLLYNFPEECRLILIDPKMLELSVQRYSSFTYGSGYRS